METLAIKAESPESGRAMLAALSMFDAELLGGDEGCEVVVTLGGDGEIVAVFNALEEYLTDRGGGPAEVELNGHTYVVHPERGGI